MDTISFDKLLLKTAFCCMASDGNIDKREIALIKTMCGSSSLLKEFNFQEEINSLVKKINIRGKEFIAYYFDLLKKSILTEKEELTLIDFAIQTIKSDEKIEYSEIKFFKNIRHRLKVSDEIILNVRKLRFSEFNLNINFTLIGVGILLFMINNIINNLIFKILNII